jgi:Response regulator receiver domain
VAALLGPSRIYFSGLSLLRSAGQWGLFQQSATPPLGRGPCRGIRLCCHCWKPASRCVLDAPMPRPPERNDLRDHKPSDVAISSRIASLARNKPRDPIRILVVEDEAAVGAILREAFAAEGFVVAEARNKAALFRSLEAESVDLITLDLALGHDDGLELARQIRTLRNIPIIMITGRGAHSTGW